VVVALVGYTNAGKSSLLNALTQAGVLAEDRLFATLETRARRICLPDVPPMVLTDTVGFIREMPRELFSAFRATFEETADAHLLLEVIDASDAEYPEHMQTTARVLRDLGLEAVHRVHVFNKTDLISPEERIALENNSNSIAVSAHERETLRRLLDKLSEQVQTLHRVSSSVATSPE
jgi:GTP-binding protein HflX